MRISQYAEFLLRSESIPASEITARLGVEPDALRVRGSRDPVRVVPRVHIWQLNARKIDVPVDDQTDEIVQRLSPVRMLIGDLVRELPVSAVLSVCRNFDDPEGQDDEGTPPALAVQGFEKLGGQHQLLGWHLDRRVLQFLMDTGAELDVDEYG